MGPNADDICEDEAISAIRILEDTFDEPHEEHDGDAISEGEAGSDADRSDRDDAEPEVSDAESECDVKHTLAKHGLEIGEDWVLRRLSDGERLGRLSSAQGKFLKADCYVHKAADSGLVNSKDKCRCTLPWDGGLNGRKGFRSLECTLVKWLVKGTATAVDIESHRGSAVSLMHDYRK